MTLPQHTLRLCKKAHDDWEALDRIKNLCVENMGIDALEFWVQLRNYMPDSEELADIVHIWETQEC